MKIFQRYFLKEFLASFLLGLGVFTLLLSLGNFLPFLRLILGKGRGGWSILSALYHVLLLSLPYSLPMGLLVGVISTWGRFQSEGEFTALKTAGINEFTATSPLLFSPLLLSSLALLLFLEVSPRSGYLLKTLSHRMEKSKIIAEKVFLDNLQDYLLYVEKVKDHRLKNIILYYAPEKSTTSQRRRRILFAQKGEFVINREKKTLLLNLFQGSIEETREGKPEIIYRANFQRYGMEIPIKKLSTSPHKKLMDMTWKELKKECERLREKGWKPLPIKVEQQKRLSLSFVSFLFLLTGIIWGRKTQEKGRWKNLGLSIPIIIGYYLLFSLGEALALKGFSPYWVWIPYMVGIPLSFFYLIK